MIMSNKTITNIQYLYNLAGSATKLAASLDLPGRTVENWRVSGIPITHWDKIMKLYDVTPAELYLITKAARKSLTNPSRCK